MQCSGILVDGLHSYRDFGECVASSDTGMPQRKTVTSTVPYMSGFYDFSDLYGGAAAYESREVSYSFNLVGTREEVQLKKTALMAWLGNVQQGDIYDDDIYLKHFVGSFESASWEEDDSGMGSTLTVTFLCQPFMVADEPTTIRLEDGTHAVTVVGQPTRATVVPEASATIAINGVSQSVSVETELTAPMLHGDNQVVVTGGPVILSWKELTF